MCGLPTPREVLRPIIDDLPAVTPAMVGAREAGISNTDFLTLAAGFGAGATPAGSGGASAGAGADSTGSASAGVSGSGGGAEGVFPGEEGFPGEASPGQGDPAGGATGTGKVGGSDILGTLKTLAPVIMAGSSILSAMSAAEQAKDAKKQANGLNKADLTPPTMPQAAIDPDLTAIRKKNSLLFGLDSPASTDLTRGNASTGNLGRVTLLGGSSRLAA